MPTWLISATPEIQQWAQQQNIAYDGYYTQLSDVTITAKDMVIGQLSVSDAAQVCQQGGYYWDLAVDLNNLPNIDALHAFLVQLNPDAPSLKRMATDAPPTQETALEEESPAQDTEASTSPTTPEAAFPAAKALSKKEIHDYEYALFNAYAYNPNHPEVAEQKAARLLEEIKQYANVDVALLNQFERVQKQGRHAVTMIKSLQNKIDSGVSEAELEEWVTKQEQSQSYYTRKRLRLNLDRALKFKKDKKANRQKNSEFEVSLAHVALHEGVHPQSLRALAPATEWNFYIDETGSHFSIDSQELNESDQKLGRVVALALPDYHNLPALKKPTHAIDLSHKEIQQLLKVLTQSHIGLLGATTKTDLLNHNWISSIHQLIRWAILLLPINKSQPTKIRIHIEQRDQYNRDGQLTALEEVLNNDLKQIAPERFANTTVSLHIMDKNNPYNGYVDVIANCWGSRDKTKRKMLTRTRWLGHCLLQDISISQIEHVYRRIVQHEHIPGYEWFELCAYVEKETEHSLLNDLLSALGQSVQKDAALWSHYLKATQQHLQQKQFTTHQLSTALNWLEQYQPSEQHLPAHLQLMLYSLQLASGNHVGATHLQQIEKLLPLIEQLKDEDAAAACQALLRMAVRSTHLYEFDGAIMQYIDQWLAYPIALPTLLNHAKLHSTKGQLLAFSSQYEAAISHFDQALAALDRLSDAEQRQANQAQTRVYKAIVLQDAQHPDAIDFSLKLIHGATQATGLKAIERLARSGNASTALRFAHYLFLRLAITTPHLDSALIDAYLNQRDEWHDEDSHPWMLIDAYRAWLLHRQNLNTEGQHLMQRAIDACIDNGAPMLIWMGHCLHALGISLGQTVHLPLNTPPPANHYPATQLDTLKKATHCPQRLQALQPLLPFNFH